MGIVYDIFISYSKNDEAFAELLEKQLENYVPPKTISGLHKIQVFRYAADRTGTDYEEAIYKYLKESTTLVVLCSPSSRKSRYVDGEIELFNKEKPRNKIIPILLAGIPNNEAENESEKAFPENLFLKYKMPLAINFKNFKIKADK
jgi:TIR domain